MEKSYFPLMFSLKNCEGFGAHLKIYIFEGTMLTWDLKLAYQMFSARLIHRQNMICCVIFAHDNVAQSLHTINPPFML